jgi:hypothetical protein
MSVRNPLFDFKELFQFFVIQLLFHKDSGFHIYSMI